MSWAKFGERSLKDFKWSNIQVRVWVWFGSRGMQGMIGRDGECCVCLGSNFLDKSRQTHTPHNHQHQTRINKQEAIAEAEGLDFGEVPAFLFAQNPVEWYDEESE